MSGTVSVRNLQRRRKIDVRWLRQVAFRVLEEELTARDYDIGICLVSAPRMTRLNEDFLGHQGSTDVITFDYSGRRSQARLIGEIVICVDEAVAQARQFHVTWQAEIVRYFVHGILHLSGYDDTTSLARRKMKREEERLLRRRRILTA